MDGYALGWRWERRRAVPVRHSHRHPLLRRPGGRSCLVCGVQGMGSLGAGVRMNGVGVVGVDMAVGAIGMSAWCGQWIMRWSRR
jgi:alanine dehydrogenase